MGNGVSILIPDIVKNVGNYALKRNRKRKRNIDDIEKVIEDALHTPKKMKLLTTAKYIYQVLFEEGKNSDVTVRALGEEFHLHKIYLCQSAYFASMFGGSWLESTKDFISIDVIDPCITINSLKIVFGSLYTSEIILNPVEIVSILATATMFQLDGLIEKCTEVMMDTINTKTALGYYNAGCVYGNNSLKSVCVKWFLINLMTFYSSNPIINLKEIPVKLMSELVAHPDLFVLQTEYSVYIMLKYWMYLIVNDSDGEPSAKEVNSYFSSRQDDMPYLLTEAGDRFVPAFEGLRLHNLVSHQMDVEVVLKDNIIPRTWLYPVVLNQWKKVLRINQNEDKGPSDISDEIFLNTSLRCGRVLTAGERNIWRWSGFHFGVDLLMISDGTTLSVKRNHRSEFEQLLSFQSSRHLAIRVTVASLNEQRQTVFFKQSEIQKVCLSKGEEQQIMTLDKDLIYPIIISANILYTSPESVQTSQEEVIQTVT